MNPKPQSLFATPTFWVILIIALQTIGPQLERMADAKAVTVKDMVVIFNLLVGGAAVLVARVNDISDVYTPKGIPGPNKEDIATKIITKAIDKF
jgi:hypothetical protein